MPEHAASVRLLPAARAAILDRAAAALPDECCGILVGRPATPVEPAIVVAAHAAPNRAATARSRSFAIAAADVARAARAARDDGLDLIGFYHSHPQGAAQPSASDVVQASAWPGYLHLIAAPNDPARLRAWRTDPSHWCEQSFL